MKASEIIFILFLVLHIISGTTGLITGILNMAMKKGTRVHRIIGFVFLSAMLTTGFSAMALAFLHFNFFLLLISVFTVYMSGMGARYMHLRELQKGQKPSIIDWLLVVLMLLGAVSFITYGGLHLAVRNLFGIVHLVFGGFGLLFAVQDIRNFLGLVAEGKYWLTAHLQRMCGSYIAAATAFLVVNGSVLPQWIPSVIPWLLPTVVITPLIVVWSRKYGK